MKNRIKNPLERKKKGAVVTLCIVCTLFFMAAGCGSHSEEEADHKDIGLKNVLLSSCDSNTKSTSTNFDEYIKFSSVSKSTLKIEHMFFMNCCTEDIGI